MEVISDVILPRCADDPGAMISDDSDNAELLNFCFLCSRQFFHEGLENFDIGVRKDEEILESFFEELGPVDRALLDCCPSCKTVCKTLISTKEALSCLIDEIFSMLRESRNFSFLASKSQVVTRLFQPPSIICETSSSYLQNFPKDISNVSSNSANSVSVTSFPSQFDLRLDSSNLSDSLDLNLSHNPISAVSISTASCTSKNKPSPKKERKNVKDKLISNLPTFNGEVGGGNSNSEFTLFNETINTMINSASDNACDVSEVVIRDNQKDSREIFENFRPPLPLPSRLPMINVYGNETSFVKGMARIQECAEAQELSQSSTQGINHPKSSTPAPVREAPTEAVHESISGRQVKYVPMAASVLNMTSSELIMEMQHPPVLMPDIQSMSAPIIQEIIQTPVPDLKPRLENKSNHMKEPEKNTDPIPVVKVADSKSSSVVISAPVRKPATRKAPALIPIQSQLTIRKVGDVTKSPLKVNVKFKPNKPMFKKKRTHPPLSFPGRKLTAYSNLLHIPKPPSSGGEPEKYSKTELKKVNSLNSKACSDKVKPLLPLTKGGKNLNAIKPKNIKKNEEIILERTKLSISSVSSFKKTKKVVQTFPKINDQNVPELEKPLQVTPIFSKTIAENHSEEKSEKVSEKTVDSTEQFHCAKCDKSFTASKYLKQHNYHKHSQQKSQEFVCKICDITYKQKRGLKYHIAAMHSNTPQFVCEICDKTFTQKAGLQRHLDLHNEKHRFQCEQCGKQFIHHSSLRIHVESHKGLEKNLKCSECGLGFTQKGHLLRHLRTHKGEKQHSCPFCDKSFSERYNLRAHLKCHEENRKRHFCQNCPKSFSKKYNLHKHMKTHHDNSEHNNNQDDLDFECESSRSSIDDFDNEPEESDS